MRLAVWHFVLTWLAAAMAVGPASALDTRVRADYLLDAAHGPHLDVVPNASQLSIAGTPRLGNLTVTLTGFGPMLRLTLQEPERYALSVGQHDSTMANSNDISRASLGYLYDNNSYSYEEGEFELRQLKTNSSGQVIALWFTFQIWSPFLSRAIVRGEVRWNADTSLFVRLPRTVTASPGQALSIRFQGIETRGRPVSLSGVALPEGVRIQPVDSTSADLIWDKVPADEGNYPIQVRVVNDEGLEADAEVLVRVRRPFLLSVEGDAGDPTSLGQPALFTPQNSTYARDGWSDIPGSEVFAFYQRRRSYIIQTGRIGSETIAEGTYEDVPYISARSPEEPGWFLNIDNRYCTRLTSTRMIVRRLRYAVDGNLLSFWIDVEQRCKDATGGLRLSMRYNVDTTLDVQAPARVWRTRGEPVDFTVTTRTTESTPPRLTAIALPSGAQFTDLGDGTGRFHWNAAPPVGAPAYFTVVATTAQGARDTVTSRIASRPSFAFAIEAPRLSYPEPVTRVVRTGNELGMRLTEAADSSLSFVLQGRGERYEARFIAPGQRRVTPGDYGATTYDRGQRENRMRVITNLGSYDCFGTGHAHIRRLDRNGDGSIRSFWAVFDQICDDKGTVDRYSLRYEADSTLSWNHPGEHFAALEQATQLEIQAATSPATPVNLRALSLPQGAQFTDHGDAHATLSWPSGPQEPRLARARVEAERPGGVRDTTELVMNAFVAATMVVGPTSPDPYAYELRQEIRAPEASFAVDRLYAGTVEATVANPDGAWRLRFTAPSDAALDHAVHRRCASCPAPVTDFAITRVPYLAADLTNSHFQIRKLKRTPDGRIRSLWAVFDHDMSYMSPLEGELRIAADTAVYVSRVDTAGVEAGRAVRLAFTAKDTRGQPLQWTLDGAPAGSVFRDAGDGTATLDWLVPDTTLGTTLLRAIATSSDGHADTAFTTIRVVRPLLYTLQGANVPTSRPMPFRRTGVDAGIVAEQTPDSSLALSVLGPESLAYLFLKPAFGRPVRKGTYDPVNGYQTQFLDQPGATLMMLTHLGCYGQIKDRSFRIRRIRYDVNRKVTSLWALFSTRCPDAWGPDGFMEGEIRIGSDTTAFVDAPALRVVWQRQPTAFGVRAGDGRGQPVTLRLLEQPAGTEAHVIRPDSLYVTYDASAPSGSIVQLRFAAMSDDGSADTVTTELRVFGSDRFSYQTVASDGVSRGPLTILPMSGGPVTASFTGLTVNGSASQRPSASYTLTATIPSGPTFRTGRYRDGRTSQRPSLLSAEFHVGSTQFGATPCASQDTGSFEVRQFRTRADGSISRLWLTFDRSCPGDRLAGDFMIGADTTTWIMGPGDTTVEFGAVVELPYQAHGRLAGAGWRMATSGPGFQLTTLPPDEAVVRWTAGTAGDHVVQMTAGTGADAESVSTTVHVITKDFLSLRSGPNSRFPAGIDMRWTGREALLYFFQDPYTRGVLLFANTPAEQVMRLQIDRIDRTPLTPGTYALGAGSPIVLDLVSRSEQVAYVGGTLTIHEAVYDGNVLISSLWGEYDLTPLSGSPIHGEFHLYARDLPTPVGTSVVEARWQDDAVHLRWYVPGRVGAEVQVERRLADADWATLGASTVRVNGMAEFTDATVTPGSVVAYRLRVNGRVEPASEVELTPPATASRVAFDRAGPNPGPGPLRFSITLPQAGVADWSLVDVAGRVIAARHGLALPAGHSTIDASDIGPLRPGTYFARFEWAGQGLTRSVIVLQ